MQCWPIITKHRLHSSLVLGVVDITVYLVALFLSQPRFHVGQDMVTKLLKMQMLSDDDELAYSPDSARYVLTLIPK